jgi:Helix-turn-helix domain
MKTEPLATPDEVAAYIRRPPRLLADWRSRGRGPDYIKIEGGQIRYDWSDVRAWLARQRHDTSASASA